MLFDGLCLTALTSKAAVTSLVRHFCSLKEIFDSEKSVTAEIGPGSACQIEDELLSLGLRTALASGIQKIYFSKENGQKLIDAADGVGLRLVEGLRNLCLCRILPLD